MYRNGVNKRIPLVVNGLIQRMNSRGNRDKQSHLADSIREVAWELIAAKGAASLSLRAIGRKLGVTAPAIYNYYADRDALVTALIIEAFTDFGSSQLEAADGMAADDLQGRMLAIGRAYRNWAIKHPQRYLLIFGAPLPGYVPPREEIRPSGSRSLRALLSTIEEFRRLDRLNLVDLPPLRSEREEEFNLWRQWVGAVHEDTLTVALLIWGRVHGMVSLEIGSHLPPFGPDPQALYEFELRAIHEQFLKE